MFKRCSLAVIGLCVFGVAGQAYAAEEEFSFRGAKFGMTKAELKKVLKVECPKPDYSDHCMERFPRIGNILAYSVSYNFENGKIQDIDADFRNENFELAREAVTLKYGPPTSYQVKAALEGGFSVPATQWIWERPTVEIVMQYPHFYHNNGSLRYLPPGSFKANAEAQKKQSQRNAQEF